MISGTIILILLAAYLVGSIPFGYLIARGKGIDLFQSGSGNIGATNVGRILGQHWGMLVFLLDFLKGAVPTFLAQWLVPSLSTDLINGPYQNWLGAIVAVAAIIGHMFPIYLRFHGGKGVATGSGTMVVLCPLPTAVAVLVWVTTVFSFRFISLASLLAALSLCLARVFFSEDSCSRDNLPATLYCFLASIIIVIKHRSNMMRLWRGTENGLKERTMFGFSQRAAHLIALALWFGSSVFFSFIEAPIIFATFKEVAHNPPGDRTAFVPINRDLDSGKMDELGSALAGTAVGPVFPMLFRTHLLCAIVALLTALGWWKAPGRIHHWRVYLLTLSGLVTAAAWLISTKVSALRVERFSLDPALAMSAKEQFASWHLVSLALSFLMTILVFCALLLAARLPDSKCHTNP